MDEIARRQFLSYQKVPSEVWQVRLVRLPTWIFGEDMAEPSRMTIGFCVYPRTGEIVLEDAVDAEDAEEMTGLAAQTLSAAARKWRPPTGRSRPGAADRPRLRHRFPGAGLQAAVRQNGVPGRRVSGVPSQSVSIVAAPGRIYPRCPSHPRPLVRPLRSARRAATTGS